jgi:ubiquinone/menaquinone biosynthesis C-methylase UbiE
LVFRHFDHFSQAEAYFREIYRVLSDNGSFMIELPVYRWPTMHGLFSLIYRTRKMLGQSRAVLRRYLLRLGLTQPFMRALIYNIDWLQHTLTSLGFHDIEVRIFPSSNQPMLWHSVVLARKRTST